MAAKPSDGKPKEKMIPNGIKFLFGGLSGMAATCVVQPLDLVKTRMQLTGTKVSSFKVVSDIVVKEGTLALYTGLGAGLLRQASYTTTRLGCFTYMFDQYKIEYGVPPGFGVKMLMGVVAGAIGAYIGTPAEVSLIRMMGDKRLPADQRRNYTGVFNALGRIVREEGVLTLWKGAGPTVARAMVVNAAQLGTYSQAREMLVKHMDGILLHFTASMISGLVTTIASMPVDIIKTRIQNAKGDQAPITVVRNILMKEGVFSLWKGFLPYYARLGPHTTLTFVFLEQLNALYFRLT